MSSSARRDGLPALVFVSQAHSGASRRMESLVAWVKVTHKNALDVVDVDADVHPALVSELGVIEVPALVLIKDQCVLGRLEGKATGRQIDAFLRQYLVDS